MMQNGWGRQGSRRYCRHSMLPIIGVGMMAAGLLLLFACIPGWAWMALTGVVLIVAGYALIRLQAGR